MYFSTKTRGVYPTFGTNRQLLGAGVALPSRGRRIDTVRQCGVALWTSQVFAHFYKYILSLSIVSTFFYYNNIAIRQVTSLTLTRKALY